LVDGRDSVSPTDADTTATGRVRRRVLEETRRVLEETRRSEGFF